MAIITGSGNMTVKNKGPHRWISNGPNSERSSMRIFLPGKNTDNSMEYMMKSFIRISGIIKTWGNRVI